MPKFLSNIDLSNNQLVNALLETLAADPGSPTNSRIWVDSTNNVLKVRLNGVTISLGRLDQITAPAAALGMNSQRITALADPTGATDAVNLQYLQAYSMGARAWKDPVRVVSTANVATLAGGAPNTVDGVTLVANDRVLVAGQTTASQNGIYVVTTVGTGANGTWTRATDADAGTELQPGTAVRVNEGTTNADTSWFITSDAAITIGTTAITWTKLTAGGSGTVVSFAATGPGATGTSWVVNHALGSQDVTWSLRQVSDNAFVQADAVSTDANNLTFSFGQSVTLNTLRVVVHK